MDINRFINHLHTLRLIDLTREGALVKLIPLGFLGQAVQWWVIKVPYITKIVYYTGNLDTFAPILKKEFNIPHAMANTKFHGYVLDNRKFIKDRKIKINYYRLYRWA